MNYDLLSFALFQFVFTLITGVLVLYISFRILNRFVGQVYNLSFKNVAYAILCAAILFSVGYLLSGVHQPSMSAIRTLKNSSQLSSQFIWDAFKYVSLFLVLGFGIALMINTISIALFTYMTKGVKEFKEIQEENLAVAIITAAIIVSTTLIMRDSMMLIMESFIPYPELKEFVR